MLTVDINENKFSLKRRRSRFPNSSLTLQTVRQSHEFGRRQMKVFVAVLKLQRQVVGRLLADHRTLGGHEPRHDAAVEQG